MKVLLNERLVLYSSAVVSPKESVGHSLVRFVILFSADVTLVIRFLDDGWGIGTDVEARRFIKDIKYRPTAFGEGKGVRSKPMQGDHVSSIFNPLQSINQLLILIN